MKITNHCFMRYLQRTGSFEKYSKKIMNIVENGEKIEPRRPEIKLLNHNFVGADYYRRGGLVAVVVGGCIVTVMTYEKNQWR